MKIYPRSIAVQEDNDYYELFIRNSASDGRVLLFKIKRSERKMVEFSPKYGIVHGGSTSSIKVKVTNRALANSRLLVKLVVLKDSLLEDDFDTSWQTASKRNGEVKKIIDITNTTIEDSSNTKLNGNEKNFSIIPRKNTGKQLMLSPPSINIARMRSADSGDGMSDTSSISMTQSMSSAAFYSPSVTANSSPTSVGPKPSLNHHDMLGQHSIDTTHGTEIDFNHHATAPGSSLEDSMEVGNDAAKHSGGSESPNNNSNYSIGAADTSSEDPAVITALLQKLVTSPNTATLLAGIVKALQTSNSSAATTALNRPHASTPTAVEQHKGYSHQQLQGQSGEHIFSATAFPPTQAEATQRFIDAQDSHFPSVRSGDEYISRKEVREKHEVSGKIVQTYSRLNPLKSNNRRRNSENGVNNFAVVSGGSLMLEIFGEKVNNDLFVLIAEARIEEIFEQKMKPVALELSSVSISSLSESIGNLFQNKDITPTHDVALKEKLNAMRSIYFEEALKHLSVNDCQITAIDSSLNRFNQLTSLNLSGNAIRSIDAPIQLPQLKSLDLSHNQLVSLDYLQLLVNLTTLIVSNNDITSLGLSVNMLVSLSKCLSTLDMSHNPVCNDNHYAQEVVHVLPRLRFFDGFDLEDMEKSYSYSFRKSGGTPQRQRGDSSSVTTASNKRLPDLPDEALSVSSRSSAGDMRGKGFKDKKADFERRLFAALGQRRRSAGRASPIPAKQVHSSPRSSFFQASARPISALSSSRSTRANKSNHKHFSYDNLSDDEEEMRSVEESLKYLSHNKQRHTSSSTEEPYPANTLANENNNLSVHRVSSLRGRYFRATSGENSPIEMLRSSAEEEVGPDLLSEQCQRPQPQSQPSTSSTNYVNPTPAPTQSPTTAVASATTVATVPTIAPAPAPELIQQWAGHYTSKEVEGFEPSHIPVIDDNSTLLEPTESLRLRRQFLGVANRSARFPEHSQNHSNSAMYSTFSLGDGRGHNNSQASRKSRLSSNRSAGKGYFSESELHSHGPSRHSYSARKLANVTTWSEVEFMQMQEEEKYGQWHPRYRVPKPIFGFSRPFIHRHAPSLKDHAPLFDTTVQRMRDSFRKFPARGTFARAGKGLPGEWYPMDYSEVEAIRRQGYFHDTIGEITKDSYRDSAGRKMDRGVNRSYDGSVLGKAAPSTTDGSYGPAKFLQEALVSPRGSVSISPSKQGRRQTWGPHMSRFDSAASMVHAYDDFSNFRKWHQGMFDYPNEKSEFENKSISALNLEYPSFQQQEGNLISEYADEYALNRPGSANARNAEKGAVIEDRNDEETMDFELHQNVQVFQPPPPPLPADSHSSDPSKQHPLNHSTVVSTSRASPVATAGEEKGSAGAARQVSLLDMDRADNEDMLFPSSTPTKTSSPPRSYTDFSFEEDRRVYDALPNFTSVNMQSLDVSNQEFEGKKSSSEVKAESEFSKPALYMSTMVEKIDAEEAELANYMSWLEELQQQDQGQEQNHDQRQEQEQEQRTSTKEANHLPQRHISMDGGVASLSGSGSGSASGIPRYTSHRPSHLSTTHDPRADTRRIHSTNQPSEDEPVLKVFSPRDAAMRAGQTESSPNNSRIGKTAFQSRSQF